MESSEKHRLNGDRARVRVLFVPQWYPSKDDQNSVIGTFCREHVRSAALFDDVAVLVFTRRASYQPSLSWKMVDDCGIPTFYASYGALPIPKTGLPLFYLHFSRAIRRCLREWGPPDVIHTQDSYAYHVIRLTRRLRIPFVMSQHWTAFMERKLNSQMLRQFQWAFARSARVLAANKFASRDYDLYGLTASVYSKSEGRAKKILDCLEVGTAYWNCCDRVSPYLPWSGRRHSGTGSTLSYLGIQSFVRPKAYHLRLT